VRDFKIYVEGIGKWINFVDREIELRQLLDFAERGHPFPVAIYGPEGCGKTTLWECFLEELKGKLSSLPEEEEEAKKKLEREISVRESLIRKAR